MLILPDAQADLLRVSLEDGILLVEFSHPKKTNPFSRKMTVALRDLATRINSAPEVKAVFLTGGVDRSFSAGGDFEDVSKLSERVQIRGYLLEIIDLYVALLAIEAPVVAEIDHFAIGQGLQVAMTADWRIASSRAQTAMPELKNGVACPLGVTLLEHFLGRAAMLKAVVGCGSLDARQALDLGLVTEVVSESELRERAWARVREFAAYPSVPFRATKRFYNRGLIQRFHEAREEAAAAHVESFLHRSGQAHFEKILGKANGK